jgi:hypothetical protein
VKDAEEELKSESCLIRHAHRFAHFALPAVDSLLIHFSAGQKEHVSLFSLAETSTLLEGAI